MIHPELQEEVARVGGQVATSYELVETLIDTAERCGVPFHILALVMGAMAVGGTTTRYGREEGRRVVDQMANFVDEESFWKAWSALDNPPS